MRAKVGSALLELPKSFGRPPKGNPRLGRETAKEKAVRTKSFRKDNLLMREEKLHVPGSVSEALGVRHSVGGTDSGNRNYHVDLNLMLDRENNPSFWR